jgi:hypothetical protein
VTRIIIQYLLPLILPSLIYFLWAWLARPRGAKKSFAESLREGPWFWLIASGFALVGIVYVVTATMLGSEPGGTYHPPTWENNQIVPGRFGDDKN